MTHYKHITRMEYEKMRGFWVRIVRLKAKIFIQKSFSDNHYGGKKKAFKAALLFRDNTLTNLSRKGYGREYRKFCEKATKKNRFSMIGGVYAVWKQRSKYKKPYKNWRGTYSPNKYKSACKSFAVNKYGDKEAYELAVAFRQKGLIELKNRRSKE